MNKPKFIIVHHSGGTDANRFADTSAHTVSIINEWHKKKDFLLSESGYYVGYHFVIEKSGKVTQTKLVAETGCHTIGLNNQSIGICLVGNFDRPLDWENSYPSRLQIESLKFLLTKLTDKYDIHLNNIVPHRRFANKTCYGKNLADDWARNLLIDDPKEALKRQISILQEIIKIYIQLIAIFKSKK